MITRATGYLTLSDAPVPDATRQLQAEGYAVLRSAFGPDDVAELAGEIDKVFSELPPDVRSTRGGTGHYAPFRYEMLNRSAACQRAAGHPATLATVEPLLGEDCHVIANTAWRQPPAEDRHGGRFWHIDAGPHVPRPPDVPWDPRIPYPVFAVATHVLLQDCPIEAGPTGVLPGSHTSGQAPPRERASDVDLTWDGRGFVPLTGSAGDVLLFVSDVWHRRLPSGTGDPGRFFLQVHYGRRDLAQRLRTTVEANQLSAETVERATSRRERTLIGLHEPGFYDG